MERGSKKENSNRLSHSGLETDAHSFNRGSQSLGTLGWKVGAPKGPIILQSQGQTPMHSALSTLLGSSSTTWTL